MNFVRESSFAEYVRWYLEREFRKNNRESDNPSGFKDEEIIKYMETNYPGKLRPWFKNGKWSIRIPDREDIDSLVCVEGRWTKEFLIPENLRIEKDYRILKQIVKNARELKYFSKTEEELKSIGDGYRSHYKYYEEFKNPEDKKLPELTKHDRIVLCSLEKEEKSANPSGSYYLHDGFNRLLTYQYLISYCDFSINGVIEAFVVELP